MNETCTYSTVVLTIDACLVQTSSGTCPLCKPITGFGVVISLKNYVYYIHKPYIPAVSGSQSSDNGSDNNEQKEPEITFAQVMAGLTVLAVCYLAAHSEQARVMPEVSLSYFLQHMLYTGEVCPCRYYGCGLKFTKL